MVQLSFKPHREQAPLLAACTKTPVPAERAPAAVGSAVPHIDVSFDDLPDPVTKPITFDDIVGDDFDFTPAADREPFQAVYPGVSADALAWLRAQDAVDEQPAAPRPMPGRDCIEYLTAVSVAIMADHDTHLDTLRVIDDILASAPAVLAHGTGLSADLLGLALSEIAAMLDEQPKAGA